MKIENYLLISSSEQIFAWQPANKTSSKFKSGFPDNVVISFVERHNISSFIRAPIVPNVKVSANLAIGSDRRITQLAPLNTVICYRVKNFWHNLHFLNASSAIGIDKSRKCILFADQKQDDRKEFTLAKSPKPIEIVIAYQLDVRRKSTSISTLVSEPFSYGQKMKFPETKGQRVKVRVEQEGQVSTKYLEL